MGYRSDVAFCISVDGYDKAKLESMQKFKSLVGFFKLSTFHILATGSEYDLKTPSHDGTGIGWKDGCVLFYASDWKWYPDYDIVQAFDEFWSQMQEMNGISGYFARVGEEQKDIEEVTFGDDPYYDFFRPFSHLDLHDTIIGEFITDEEKQDAIRI